MPKKELLILASIMLLGTFDWLTTITGILFFGATELNPLLASLTQTNMIFFSVVKFLAITFASLAFYKAVCLTNQKGNDWNYIKRFINGGYSMTFLLLAAVVSANMINIVKV
jgi:amino acid transporter